MAKQGGRRDPNLVSEGGGRRISEGMGGLNPCGGWTPLWEGAFQSRGKRGELGPGGKAHFWWERTLFCSLGGERASRFGKRGPDSGGRRPGSAPWGHGRRTASRVDGPPHAPRRRALTCRPGLRSAGDARAPVRRLRPAAPALRAPARPASAPLPPATRGASWLPEPRRPIGAAGPGPRSRRSQ